MRVAKGLHLLYPARPDSARGRVRSVEKLAAQPGKSFAPQPDEPTRRDPVGDLLRREPQPFELPPRHRPVLANMETSGI